MIVSFKTTIYTRIYKTKKMKSITLQQQQRRRLFQQQQQSSPNDYYYCCTSFFHYNSNYYFCCKNYILYYIILFVVVISIQSIIYHSIHYYGTIQIVPLYYYYYNNNNNNTNEYNRNTTYDIFLLSIQQQQVQHEQEQLQESLYITDSANTDSHVFHYSNNNNNNNNSNITEHLPIEQLQVSSRITEENNNISPPPLQHPTFNNKDVSNHSSNTNTNRNTTNSNHTIIIDVISIGSITRTEYQMTQEQTFGTHPTIRNFYRITEVNDTIDSNNNGTCINTVSQDQLDGIIQFCNKQWDRSTSTVRTWLRKRLKPYRYDGISISSLCAQKRPIDALYQILLQQQQQQQYINQNLDSLPDYIVLINDDTFLNMDPLIKSLTKLHVYDHNHSTSLLLSSSSSSSLLLQDGSSSSSNNSNHGLHILGGCVHNFPPGLQFRHPDGGFGTILSKDVLLRLLRPLYCNHGNVEDNKYIAQDGFTKMACWRLYEQNHFHELQYFSNGMSILDLMYKYTKSLSYVHANEWVNGDGYCFHSDQALGYFLGFYHIGIPDSILHDVNDMSDNVRMESPYGYMEIRANDVDNDDSDDDATTTTIVSSSQCQNTYYEQCDRNDIICLYIKPKEMERINNENTYHEDEMKAKLLQQEAARNNETINIDIISIGSLLKPHLQYAQEQSFRQHPNVRNWFPITELNDTDTTCYTNLTIEQMNEIRTKCQPGTNGQSYISDRISRILFRPRNHTGWLCAQKRPIDGLYNAIQHYRTAMNTNNNNNTSNGDHNSLALPLPNYLAIIDDDTYMNIPHLLEILPKLYPSHDTFGLTGCRYMIWPGRLQFTFAYGGFATILSRRAIENLIRPIHCNITNNDSTNDSIIHENDGFNQMACWRLHQNAFGEKASYIDGMSVLDIMYSFSSKQLYTKVDEWEDSNRGFCFHSDHALAYFIGFYHILVPDTVWSTKQFNQPIIPQNRRQRDRHPYYNDNLRKQYSYHNVGRDGEHNSCKFVKRKCTYEAPLCHYVTENQMMYFYNKQIG